jgi:hypothetical protein
LSFGQGFFAVTCRSLGLGIAEDLGEDEDSLRDVANEMEIEDGTIWVYGVGEDGVMAFTDFGIKNLIELIRFYKEKTELLRR